MRIIAVAMTKGGVGKTTTAVNIAHGLAMQDHRVLLVDTDTQGQCAKALGIKPDFTLAEVLAGQVTAAEATLKARERLYLIASDYHLSGPALGIARREIDGHTVLKNALAKVCSDYDFVVLDAAPGFDPVAVNVLSFAEEVLGPVALEPAAMVGVLDFVRHLDSIAQHNLKLSLRYVLPTFLDARILQPTEMLGQLRDHFGDRVCQPIRVNVQLAEAFGWHQTIFEYAPSSRGASDYGALVARIAADDRDADRNDTTEHVYELPEVCS
jgi:chromosome partitioning protein